MAERHGFTLIEVLIVMVVIAVLAGIGIPRYRGAHDTARYAAMRADLWNLSLKQQLYFGASIAGTGEARGRYADSPDDPALDFASSPGVTIQITVAADGAAGWAALATHSAFRDDPARGCAIFIGKAEPVPPATVPNQIACGGN